MSVRGGLPFRHPQCCTPSSCPGAGGQATFSHSERHFLWAAPRTVSTDECLLRSAGHGPRALPVPHAQASSAGGPSETPLTAALGCDHDLSVCVLGKVLAFTVQHLIQPLYGPGTHLPPTGFPQHLLSRSLSLSPPPASPNPRVCALHKHLCPTQPLPRPGAGDPQGSLGSTLQHCPEMCILGATDRGPTDPGTATSVGPGWPGSPTRA